MFKDFLQKCVHGGAAFFYVFIDIFELMAIYHTHSHIPSLPEVTVEVSQDLNSQLLGHSLELVETHPRAVLEPFY